MTSLALPVTRIEDLKTINEWDFHWKTNLNPNPNKQAQKLIFTKKCKNIRHAPVILNNTKVYQSTTPKHSQS